MAIRHKDEYSYGDDHADLREELSNYAKANEYPIDDFVDIRCSCGSEAFYLATDDEQGVAIRECVECEDQHWMGDSANYAEDADIGQHQCVCLEDVFQLSVGVHRYRNEDDSRSDTVRWLYIGCRCLACGIVGCYADWKNEFIGVQELLDAM